MKIALYSRILKDKDLDFIITLLSLLHQKKVILAIYRPYFEQIKEKIPSAIAPMIYTIFENELPQDIHFLFSIGGDGTLLDTVKMVGAKKVPVLGFNIGRLGFLTNAGRNNIRETLEALENQDFTLEKRSLLHLDSNQSIFDNKSVYALNEFSLHKQDCSAMITIHTYVDGEFLTSYWADGLIVATPTGSTAYSMSCHGPIVMPTANVLIITPVAVHNLNVRPLVIADSSVISFQVESRHPKFVCTLDSQYQIIDSSYRLSVRKEDFCLHLVHFKHNNFFETIRHKLNWGHDSRN